MARSLASGCYAPMTKQRLFNANFADKFAGAFRDVTVM